MQNAHDSLKDLFELYRQYLPTEANGLEAALSAARTHTASSRDELIALLHRVGGTAATYEHRDIAALALSLEQDLRAGRPLQQLEQRIVRLIERLRQN